MWDYCVKHEILPPDKRTMIKYLDVSKAGNPNKITRTVFDKKELDHLWDLQEDERIQIILFLIYTGLRVSELYNLKMEDLHLQERFFSMKKSKTEAGVRDVPICEKIVPIIQHWSEKGTVFLFSNKQGNQLKDRTFRNIIWEPVMDQLNMNHLPHDTRHTTVSLLTKAGVDDRIIKQIIGHKGTGVTQQVYTHIDLQTKLEAINRI
jgi:integrase